MNGDAVVIDDELLPTPAKARKDAAPERVMTSPPSSPNEPRSEEKEEKEKKAEEDKADANGVSRKTHRRTSSWSSRVFGGPFVSFVGSSKTPEEVEFERAAREARRARQGGGGRRSQRAARDDAKRAKRELIRRATEEERMFRAVLEETKRAAAESLPRRRGESAAHAACVLVTPGGRRRTREDASRSGLGRKEQEPRVGARRRRGRGDRERDRERRGGRARIDSRRGRGRGDAERGEGGSRRVASRGTPLSADAAGDGWRRTGEDPRRRVLRVARPDERERPGRVHARVRRAGGVVGRSPGLAPDGEVGPRGSV